MTPAPIAILLSGRGSNFLALHKAITEGRLDARIVLVLSNRPEAPGLQRARELGLPAVCVPRRGAGGRAGHEGRVLEELRRSGAEWVCLAGYMRVLSPSFVAAYPRRIVNIHPSLLPAFPGLDAQRQAFEYGVGVAGCTVHLVDDGVDTGPVVLQRSVDVSHCTTEGEVREAILRQEHQAYPEALQRLVSEEWALEGRRLRFLGPASERR